MPRERVTELPERVSFRMDPKLRYLTELAARATNMTLTQYIERSLETSFEKVLIDDPFLRDEPNYYDSATGISTPGEKGTGVTLASAAYWVWDTRPFRRLLTLSGATLGWLMSKEDRAILNYVGTTDDYKIILESDEKMTRFRYNEAKIEAEWSKIRAAALKSMEKSNA